jgi:hypothetical protein
LRKKIVTNNPLVQNKYTDNVLYIDGNVEQTLIKVRDMVYEGYELISHPLPASLRMLFSPYRSIVIGKKQKSETRGQKSERPDCLGQFPAPISFSNH